MVVTQIQSFQDVFQRCQRVDSSKSEIRQLEKGDAYECRAEHGSDDGREVGMVLEAPRQTFGLFQGQHGEIQHKYVAAFDI